MFKTETRLDQALKHLQGLNGVTQMHVDSLDEKVCHLEGIVEQLAALHGKEIDHFKPTTSKYERVLVDAATDEESNDD